MQYTVSMTTRMLALAALCLFLLCILLFLLGVEIGKRWGEPRPTAPAIAAPAVPSAPAVPAVHAPSVQSPDLAPVSVKP